MRTIIALSALALTSAGPASFDVDMGQMFSPKWNNLKASWRRTLGSFDVGAEYDRDRHADFLHRISVGRQLMKNDDMRLYAKGTYNFPDQAMEVECTAETNGITLKGDFDSKQQFGKLAASKDVNVGGRNLRINPSYSVRDNEVGLDLDHSVSNSDNVGVEGRFNHKSSDLTYKLRWGHKFDDNVKAATTFDFQDKRCEVKLSDTGLEKGATWSATAELPMEAGDFKDRVKLSVGRQWNL